MASARWLRPPPVCPSRSIPPRAARTPSRTSSIPTRIAWYSAAQQRNGGAITVDQRLTKDITFYGEGFYSNRRAQYLNPANISPDTTNLLSVAVPTWNPYYPIGAGAGTLRVNYSLAIEHPSLTSAYEVADRYLGGFHIALPGDWNGDIYYSETYDSSSNNVGGVVNVNAVSAALGWTIQRLRAVGQHAFVRNLDEAGQRSLPEPLLRCARRRL